MPDPHRDAALFWLNDHIGKTVEGSLSLDMGDYSTPILNVRGPLSHWRQGEEADQIAALDPDQRREDIAGLYRIGDTALDLTDVPDDLVVRDWVRPEVAENVEVDPKQGFVMEFGHGVTLTVNAFAAAPEGEDDGQ